MEKIKTFVMCYNDAITRGETLPPEGGGHVSAIKNAFDLSFASPNHFRRCNTVILNNIY